MKPTSTAVTRAPQSRGISASLRRLASRHAVGTLAVGLALAGSLHSAQAATFTYTPPATPDATNWSAGTAGHFSAIPVSAVTTEITFAPDCDYGPRCRRVHVQQRHRHRSWNKRRLSA